MGGQVIEWVTEHGQLPVNYPELPFGIDDEILTVQISMQQAEWPIRQTGYILSEALERVTVHPKGREQAPERFAVPFIHILFGEADQPFQKFPGITLRGAILGNASATHVKGSRTHSYQLSKNVHDLREKHAGNLSTCPVT